MADNTSQAKNPNSVYTDLQQWNTTQLPVLYNANRNRVLRQKPYHGAIAPPIPSPLSNINSNQIDSIDFSSYHTPPLVHSLFRAVVQHKTSWTDGTNLREVALNIFRAKTQEVGLICYFSRKHHHKTTANDLGNDDQPLVTQSPAPLVVCELVIRSILLDLSPGFAEPTEDPLRSPGIFHAHGRDAPVLDIRKVDQATVGGSPGSPQKSAGYFVVNTAPAPFFLNGDNILRDWVAGPLPEFTVIETGDTVLFWWGSEAAVDYSPSGLPLDVPLKVITSENGGHDRPPTPKTPKIDGAPPLTGTIHDSTNQETSQIQSDIHGQQGDQTQCASSATDSTGTHVLPTFGFPNLIATCHLSATLLLFFCHPSIHEFLVVQDNREILRFLDSEITDQKNQLIHFNGLGPVVDLWNTLYEYPDSVTADNAQRRSIREFLKNYRLNNRRQEDAGETFSHTINGADQHPGLISLFKISIADIKRSTSGCGHVATHNDVAVMLILPINHNMNLQSCIDAWFLPEETAEDNMWRCTACHDERDEAERVAIESQLRRQILSENQATTNAQIEKTIRDRIGTYVRSETLQKLCELPDALFVQLIRFRQTSNWAVRKKISSIVHIQERIRIPVGDEGKIDDYMLCGAVVHGGSSLEGGHYVAAIRNPAADTFDRKAWVVYNDKAPVKTTYVINDDDLTDFLYTETAPHYPNPVPYILSYRRVPPSTTDDEDSLFEGTIDEPPPDEGQHVAPNGQEKPFQGMQEGSSEEHQREPPKQIQTALSQAELGKQSQGDGETPPGFSTSSPGGSHSSFSSTPDSPIRFMIPPTLSIGFVNEGSTCHLSAALVLLFSHPGVRYFMDNASLENLRSFTHDNSPAGKPTNWIRPLEPICDMWELMQHRQPEWRIWWPSAQAIIIWTLLKNLNLRLQRQEDAAETLQGVLFEAGAQGTLGSIATFTQETSGILDCKHSASAFRERFNIWILPMKGYSDLLECINHWGGPDEAKDSSCQTCGAQRDKQRIEDGEMSVKDIEDEKQQIREKVLAKYPNKTHEQLEEDIRHRRGVTRQLRHISNIDDYPEVLVIQLKRFRNINEEGDRTCHKISDYCGIPARLTINQGADPANSRTYILCGVIAHIGGTLESGHYVTMIRVDMKNGAETTASWRLYNDDRVNPKGSELGDEDEDTDIASDSELNKYLYQDRRTPYVLSYRPADTIYVEREGDSTETISSDNSTDSQEMKTRMQKLLELQRLGLPTRLYEIVVTNYPKKQTFSIGTRSPDRSSDGTPTTMRSHKSPEQGNSVTSQPSQSSEVIEGGDTTERPGGSQGNDETTTDSPSQPKEHAKEERVEKERAEKAMLQLQLQLEMAQAENEKLQLQIKEEQREKERLEKARLEEAAWLENAWREKDNGLGKPPGLRARQPRGAVRKTYCPICKTMIHNLKDEKKTGHLKKHKEKPDLKDSFMLTAEEHQAWKDGGPTPGDNLRKGDNEEEIKKDEGDKVVTEEPTSTKPGKEDVDDGEKSRKRQRGAKKVEENKGYKEQKNGRKRSREVGENGSEEGRPGKKPKAEEDGLKEQGQPAGKPPAGKKPAGKKPPEKKPAEKKSASKNPAGKLPSGKKPAEKPPAGKKPAEKRLPAGKRLPEKNPEDGVGDDDNSKPADQDNVLPETKPDIEEEPENEGDEVVKNEEEEKPKNPKRKRKDSEGIEEFVGQKRQKTAAKYPAGKKPAKTKPAKTRLPAGKRLPATNTIKEKEENEVEDDEKTSDGKNPEQPNQHAGQPGKGPDVDEESEKEEEPKNPKRKRKNSKGEEEFGGEKRRKGSKSESQKGIKRESRKGSKSGSRKGSKSAGE